MPFDPQTYFGDPSDAAWSGSGNGKLLPLLKALQSALTGGASFTTTTATISSGQSLSAGVQLGGKGVVRLAMPAAWTAAVLTFQTSADTTNGTDGTWTDLYKSDGTEYSITVAASHSIVLNPADFASFNGLKVRSGTGAAAVAQGADRAIVLVTRPL